MFVAGLTRRCGLRSRTHADCSIESPISNIRVQSSQINVEQHRSEAERRSIEAVAARVARRVHKLSKRHYPHFVGVLDDDQNVRFNGLRAKHCLLHNEWALPELETAIISSLEAAGYVDVFVVVKKTRTTTLAQRLHKHIN